MTVARSQLVDVSVTPWYHVISKTVRGAFLLREGDEDRKQWIENRIEELSQLFAIAVGGYSVLDNHLHLAVRLAPEHVDQWSDEEVVRRWAKLFPPRDKNRKPLEVTPQLTGPAVCYAAAKRGCPRKWRLCWTVWGPIAIPGR